LLPQGRRLYLGAMMLTPERPLAGILAPLFALRGSSDFGIGDVGALREFVDWAASQDFELVQLLPINETGSDHSPYNAISSVALEPLTIELSPEAVLELLPEDFAELAPPSELARLTSGPVQYDLVKPLKRRLLARAFERFNASSWKRNDTRARQFRAFCKAEAVWLEDYALFRALIDENGGSEKWDEWPPEQRSASGARAWLARRGNAAVRQGVELAMRAAMYRQFLAWEQWRAVKAHADSRGVALMGDIPFGVSYYSADTWSRPEIFNLDWSGGTPPERILEVDAFTKKWGQNWGIPLYRWETLRERDFDWWRQRVRKVRDIFHLFRIDHLLGVFRIYSFPWRPLENGNFLPLNEEEARARTGGELPHFTPLADDTPEHRASNAAQGEEILKVLIGECGEFRLIGEDLGEVPPYVRPCLQRLGIAGFKIPQWETEPGGTPVEGARYARVSLVTYATHDHEPLRAAWDRWMATIAAAGSGDPQAANARDFAWQECRTLARFAQFEVPEITPWSDEIHERLLRAVLHSNSWLCVFMITDLFGTKQRFNVPGAVSASNWSERLDAPPSAWKNDPARVAKMARIRELLREAGRVSTADYGDGEGAHASLI